MYFTGIHVPILKNIQHQALLSSHNYDLADELHMKPIGPNL